MRAAPDRRVASGEGETARLLKEAGEGCAGDGEDGGGRATWVSAIEDEG